MKAPLALLGVSIASFYTSQKIYKQQQEQRSKTNLASTTLSEKQPQDPQPSPQNQDQQQHPWWNPPVRHEAKYAELMNETMWKDYSLKISDSDMMINWDN
ncbi:hypothetical protein H072_1628 [Dactylellina haptotyla CBS 200.50]|uniref:Uncharacterized protein n=1 Tax=Dactylellina haptotyla (strain CBS 200.50) TaxID=1284197 RepID=S8BY37_DACHA|nr:hypothetical protein H072_1628 [Dactylellina haptotyla CBS 200.50]